MAKDRLPVFQSDKVKQISCTQLNEARRSGKFAPYAHLFMLDHRHVVTDSSLTAARTLRYINGITSGRLIDYLKTVAINNHWKNCGTRQGDDCVD